MNGYPPAGDQLTPTVHDNAPQSGEQKTKRQIGFLFIGIAYPFLHYAVMLLVQVVALVVYRIQVKGLLGENATAKEIATMATELYMANSDLFSLLSNAITIAIVIALFFLVRAILKKREAEVPTVKAYFSFKKVSVPMVLMTALLAVCFYHLVIMFIGTIGSVFPELLESYTDASSSLTGETDMTFVDYLIRFIVITISAPVCEELVYRNMAISNMRKAVPVKWAVVISSVIFGVAHGNLLWILYATALGIVFGILYVRTESIWISLTAHFVFNLVGFIYSLIPSDSLGNMGMMILTAAESLLILGSMAGGPLTFIWLMKKTRKERPATVTEPADGESRSTFTPPYGMPQPPYSYPQQSYNAPQYPYSPYGQNPHYGMPNGYPYPPQICFDPQIGGYRTPEGVWYFHMQYGWQFTPYRQDRKPQGNPSSDDGRYPPSPTPADEARPADREQVADQAQDRTVETVSSDLTEEDRNES